MGRTSGLTADACVQWEGDQCSNSDNLFTGTVSYGSAGQITNLSYGYGGGGWQLNESREYNSLLQLTRQHVAGKFDQYYNYTSGANNGRIASSYDAIAGETVNYTYDSLNRLTLAETAGTGWGDLYSYDGFGNLLGRR
jgi:hypothetical protein